VQHAVMQFAGPALRRDADPIALGHPFEFTRQVRSGRPG
jgi:hypothetical protein